MDGYDNENCDVKTATGKALKLFFFALNSLTAHSDLKFRIVFRNDMERDTTIKFEITFLVW